MSQEEKQIYIKCKICDTAFMAMIVISLKHVGKDNRSITITICQECFRQIRKYTKDITIKE